MTRSSSRAFTVVELLVVVSITTVLVGLLLPAVGKARDQARMTISQANLRNLAVAHQSYAAGWNDRQLTFINDHASLYGGFFDWFENFAEQHGSDLSRGHPGNHPPVYLGWGRQRKGSGRVLYGYFCTYVHWAARCNPINIGTYRTVGVSNYHGSFRLPNAAQFHQYVGGRFYDPVFYAPKDEIVIDAVQVCLDAPDQFCLFAHARGSVGLSSYALSPAAMFAPAVFAHDDSDDDAFNGWVDPWDLAAGFRSPAFSQCLYPGLKTHMLEHHWLQNNTTDCNSGFDPGRYGVDGCEPHFFNHGWESSPVTLFYDGHVEGVGVRRAMRADGRLRRQTGSSTWGLWSKDTTWGEDGYFGEYAYDQTSTSFHILTTDGIRGRDLLGN